MKSSHRIKAFLLVICLATGCGGGVEGTGGVLGDIQPEKAIEKLDADERAEMCANIRHSSFVTYSAELSCDWLSNAYPDQVLGQTAPQNLEEWKVLCKEAKNVCLSNLRSEEEVCNNDPDKGICALDFSPFYGDCPVSAGALAACIDESIAITAFLYKETSCEDGFNMRFHPEPMPDPHPYVACTALFNSCPALNSLGFSGTDCNTVISEQLVSEQQ